jgi:hypothetical protein
LLPPQKKHQKGQAILWVLATLATCCAVMLGIFNVGQITSEKQKMVNAADAAAYSGALVEARTLNFMAYSNRLMVTTEVLVAQTVSMSSWVRYARETTENLKTITDIASFIPYVGVVAKAVSKVLEVMKKALDIAIKTTDAVTVGVIKFEAFMRGTYKAALSAAASPLTPLIAEQTARRVIEENKTVFGSRTDQAGNVPGSLTGVLAFAENAIAWNNFTHVYKNTDRKYAAEVIQKSRDAFSNDPGCGDISNCRGGSDWLNISAGFSGFEVGIEKYGGTRLSKNYDRWEAQDQLDIFFDFFGFFGDKEYIPVGWGRATAANKKTKGDLWRDRDASISNSLAYDATKEFSGWDGIPNLYDLKKIPKTAKEKYDEPKLRFVVAVVKQSGKISTSDQLGIADKPIKSNLGAIDVKPDLAADQIFALSAAHVFFERPQRDSKNWDFTAQSLMRADSRKEYGSLYNPYWQVRLTAPSLLEKTAANLLSKEKTLGSTFTQ